MKVHELLEARQHMPVDAEVILQRDPEGNGYAEVDGAELCVWHGQEALDPQRSADDHELPEALWNELRADPNAVVVWPKW
jgi:hypothetical protein